MESGQAVVVSLILFLLFIIAMHYGVAKYLFEVPDGRVFIKTHDLYYELKSPKTVSYKNIGKFIVAYTPREEE